MLKIKNEPNISKTDDIVKNTIIYIIGTIFSKIVTYFMAPLYTLYMLPEEYAISDLYYAIISIAIMILTVKIAAGMFRYVADENYDKDTILTNTLLVAVLGSIFFAGIYFLFDKIVGLLFSIKIMILLFIILSLSEIISAFCKAADMNKLFLLQSVLSSSFLLVFAYLFLAIYKKGAVGYLYSNILAQGSALVVVFFRGKVYQYIDFSKVQIPVLKRLLSFSLPLVPIAIISWLVQYSDRYIVSWYLGDAVAGIYMMAYKIPGIVTSLIGAINNAWGLSAIHKRNNVLFYNKVFGIYVKVLFIISGLIIPFTRMLAKIMYKNEFYNAWRYVPWLIFAYIFSCLSTFLEYIYYARDDTKMLAIYSCVSVIVNVILNFLLIKPMGVYGVILATVISYMLLFGGKYFYLYKKKSIGGGINKLFVYGILIFIQCFLCMSEKTGLFVLNLFILVIILYTNMDILRGILDVLVTRVKNI